MDDLLTSSPIERAVLKRVQIIHILRPLLHSVLLAGLLVAFSLWGIGREVFVAHVFENMPSFVHAGALMQFIVAAFLNTRFVVQVLSVLTVGGLVWLVREAAGVCIYLSRRAIA